MKADVKILATTLLQRASEDLITLIEAMPDERQHWKPVDTVQQTAFEQIHHCIVVNLIWTEVIGSRGVHDPTFVAPELQKMLDTRFLAANELVAALRQTTAGLSEAIKGVGDDETGDRVPVWNGTMFLSECFLYPYWHMVYHEGQINLIQTSYNDQNDYHNYAT